MQSSVAVILNPLVGAHGHDDLKQRIGRLFCEAGLDAQVEVAPTGSAIPELARTALQRGCGTIVAGGGDGTVSSVAGVIAGTDASRRSLPNAIASSKPPGRSVNVAVSLLPLLLFRLNSGAPPA